MVRDQEAATIYSGEDQSATDLAWLRRLGTVTKNVKSFLFGQSSPSGAVLKKSKLRKSALFKRRSIQHDLHPIEFKRQNFGDKTSLTNSCNESNDFSLESDGGVDKVEVHQDLSHPSSSPLCAVHLIPERRHSHCNMSPLVRKVFESTEVAQASQYSRQLKKAIAETRKVQLQANKDFTVHCSSIESFNELPIEETALENVKNIDSTAVACLSSGDSLCIPPTEITQSFSQLAVSPPENLEKVKRRLDFSAYNLAKVSSVILHKLFPSHLVCNTTVALAIIPFKQISHPIACGTYPSKTSVFS